MRFRLHEIEVTRSMLAKILAGVFLFNLLVMGGGAWYSYQHTPKVPETIQGPNVFGLLGALLVVTVGGFVGIWLGINGYIDPDQ